MTIKKIKRNAIEIKSLKELEETLRYAQSEPRAAARLHIEAAINWKETGLPVSKYMETYTKYMEAFQALGIPVSIDFYDDSRWEEQVHKNDIDFMLDSRTTPEVAKPLDQLPDISLMSWSEFNALSMDMQAEIIAVLRRARGENITAMDVINEAMGRSSGLIQEEEFSILKYDYTMANDEKEVHQMLHSKQPENQNSSKIITITEPEYAKREEHKDYGLEL